MKKLTYITFVAYVLLSTAGVIAETPGVVKDLQDISSKIELNNKKISKKKREKKTAQKHLGGMLRELRYTEIKLRKARKKYTVVKKEQEVIKVRLGVARKDYQKQKANLSSRILEMYKTKQLGVVEFLFAPKNYLMSSDAGYYFDRLIDADLTMIKKVKTQHAVLEKEKVNLMKKRQRMNTLKKTIRQKEMLLSKKKRRQKQYIANLNKQIQTIVRQNKDLERASSQLAQLIRKQGLGGKAFYGTGSFIKPVKGWLSSRYGTRFHPIFKRKIKHRGIDLAAPKGYKIRAADSGVVLVAGKKRRYRGYGKVTVIDHGINPRTKKRMSTVYAHQSRILVKEGTIIKKGDEIGWVGSTGYATGPHLHFEVRLDGVPVNPLRYVKL